MSTRITNWIACAVTLALTAGMAGKVMAQEPTVARIRRFAIVAGSNEGGRARVRLRYATSDAKAFAKVVEELGGVEAQDRVLLLDPDRAALTSAFADLAEKVEAARAPHRRLEVVVYYSGHSDEEGLLLGDELLDYRELRDLLQGLPVDVRIAVLDSCSSGALTRRKGGTRRPPFLVDASAQTKGHAFLTSASASEAAQESDRVGGSFFTHYLVTGLRGAADASGDGRVTLTEAYQFAFDETLSRTEKTQGGAQHPNYDIQLTGSGELVMTDLRQTPAGLVLREGVQGRVFIRDEHGRLVAELYKYAGKAMELGLEPGAYAVTLDRKGELSHAAITLRVGARGELDGEDLMGVDREAVALRGPTMEGPPSPSGYETRRFVVTVVPGFSTYEGSHERLIKRFGVNLVYGRSARVEGWEIGMLNQVDEHLRGVQIAAVGNINRGKWDGAQLAGAFNLTEKGGEGVQAAGAVNIANASLEGVQGAGAVNIVEGDMRGVQAAGAVNILGGRGDSHVQAAGAVNIAGGGLLGVQAAGAVNILGEGLQGLQAAGAANIADRIKGAQISPVNISGAVSGVQLGVVNVASDDVDGVQLGIINIARSYRSGMPLGLFNFVADGQHHLDVWASDLSLANVSLKFGSQRTYTLLTVGHSPERGVRRARALAGIGFGVTFPLPVLHPGLFLATDLSAHKVAFYRGALGQAAREEMRRDRAEGFAQLRCMIGFKIREHLGAFAGVSLNGYFSFDEDLDRPGIAAGRQMWWQDDGTFTQRYWPGAFVGLQI